MPHSFNIVRSCLIEEFWVLGNIFKDPAHFLKLGFIRASQAFPQFVKVNSFIVFIRSESLFVIQFQAMNSPVFLNSFGIFFVVIIPFFKREVGTS